jgi:transcriptional regulator with XRE-family HTH domain
MKQTTKYRPKTSRPPKPRSSFEAGKAAPAPSSLKSAPLVMKFPQAQFGTRLKHARLTKEMSLRQVSEKVGCSESFLSKVENGKVNPSLTMLHRIVAVLEINAAALFTDEEPPQGPVLIMKDGSRAKIRVDPRRHGPGITLERLVVNPRAALLQANIHHVAPKGTTDGFIQHEGEELGYILRGELELIVDGVTYHVREGDSFFFRSNLEHGYRNPGDVETAIVWVNTPPTF